VKAALAEQARERVVEVLVPDHVGQPDEREHQADGDEELHHELLALEVAHDRPVEADPDERRDDQHRERDRDQLGHPVVDAELPVDVREEHPDGALGEVEDAGGGVDDDQAGRRHRVDAREGQREDHHVLDRREGDRRAGPSRPAHGDDHDGRRREHEQVGPRLHDGSLIPCTPSPGRC
jgi:hypothetical protein